MKYLVLTTTDPYINLAIEEYMFRKVDDDVFMLWQNEPSVIVGKNQNVYAEVNMDFIRASKIHIARRITGGGAVYHDLGNLNYTFITSREKADGIDFEYFTKPIIEALEKLGICAKLSGRNDLQVGERKFSGNAQYSDGKRVLHHGTLLFDSDLDILSNALNVDDEKLKAKAIKSTRSRVVNLKSIINKDLDVKEFADVISEFVVSKYSPEIITAPDLDDINDIFERNKSKEWLFPERSYLSDYTLIKKKKYPFGLLEVRMNMKNDIILEIKIFGDFFGTKEISELEKKLTGCSFSEIRGLLENISVNQYIFGISNDEFIEHIKG